MMARAGFSLVELSIVLVILGLLTGGILSGQSLIRASELRAGISEYQRYSTAVQSFRDKYFAVPGDMPNATQFWGVLAASGGTSTPAAGCVSNSGSSNITAGGACDGNGDGYNSAGTVASTSTEVFQFWRELSLAGLIEGSYSGIAGPNVSGSFAGLDEVPGVNGPKSKMSNSEWSIQSFIGPWAGDSATWPGDYRNVFYFGAPLVGGGAGGANMKPEEAWNIDTKLDDGKPGTGRVIVYGRQFCTSSTMATPATDAATATYNLSIGSTLCALWFTNAF